MIVRILIAVVVVACLISFFGWIGVTLPTLTAGRPIQPVAAVGSFADAAPDGPILPSPSSATTLVGTVMLDGANAATAIPYIAYVNESGKIRTKQLIFAGQRGCDPRAGDLSCAPTGGNSAYPDLQQGEQIIVRGTFQQDRFVVTSLERAS